MSLSVGELARLAGVSVRTLHHYDEIGLLSPSERTAAGYRLYGTDDVERLQRILVYRSLGFDLTTIAQIVADPAVDTMAHLRRQHTLLTEQMQRLQRMVSSVEAMMKAKQTGVNLTPTEMKEVFGNFNPSEHEDEAEERWGGTDAYQESQRRVAKYGKAQWLQIKSEGEQINTGFVAAMNSGLSADSEAAMDLAEQHRQHISRWFYDCSYEIHRGLGEMYVADPRFAANYENLAPKLSVYVRDAILANAARADSSSNE